MSMIINGKRVAYSGGNISVINGRVIVDGRDVEIDGNAPVINIVVEGDAGNISGDFADILVKGEAQSVSTVSGDVTIGGGIDGSVQTVSGDVKVAHGSIGGNVKTVSGDIRSGK